MCHQFASALHHSFELCNVRCNFCCHPIRCCYCCCVSVCYILKVCVQDKVWEIFRVEWHWVLVTTVLIIFLSGILGSLNTAFDYRRDMQSQSLVAISLVRNLYAAMDWCCWVTNWRYFVHGCVSLHVIASDAERSEASRSSFKYRGLKIAPYLFKYQF